MSCSICLNSIRKTRSTTELPCGHLYHKRCIGSWEERGNDTCPLCRRNMSNNNFKVTLKIENLRVDRNATLNLNFEDVQNVLERLGITENELDMVSTDIMFDVEDLQSLQSIFTDLGISTSNVDPAVLDAH